MPSSVAIIYSRMLLLSELGGWYMHAITMLANLLGNLWSRNRMPGTHLCSNNLCENGATCVGEEADGSSAKCLCAPGYNGYYCENGRLV